jgi:hypothetical protein
LVGRVGENQGVGSRSEGGGIVESEGVREDGEIKVMEKVKRKGTAEEEVENQERDDRLLAKALQEEDTGIVTEKGLSKAGRRINRRVWGDTDR